MVVSMARASKLLKGAADRIIKAFMGLSDDAKNVAVFEVVLAHIDGNELLIYRKSRRFQNAW